MGSRGQYKDSRRFTLRFESHYHQVGEKIFGVKVLQFNDRANSALPEYAKTSEAYLSINRDGEMMHLRIYRDHAPILEIDVGHWKHYNKQKGYVHIHDYGRDANGNPCRKTPGRDLSPAEMAKYGTLIEKMKGSLR